MKRHFITGLAIITPLFVTIAVVVFIVNLLTDPFAGAVQGFLQGKGLQNARFLFFSGNQLVKYGSQAIILIMLFLCTALLGLVARWFFFKSIISLGDKIIHRIPVINKLYKTSQDIVTTVFDSREKSFNTVVMVPFPNTKTYCLGFVARNAPESFNASVNHTLVSVFVPTTPNPTSGYLLMYKEEELVYLDMKPEEAIKFIISCGVIHPETVHHLEKTPKSRLKARFNFSKNRD
ncbi:MAG: DUF502 domain-containing protein [Chlamydiota bacterium]